MNHPYDDDAPINYNDYEITLESYFKEVAKLEQQIERTHLFFYGIISLLIVCIPKQIFDYHVHDIALKAMAAMAIFGVMYSYWTRLRKKEVMSLEARKKNPERYGAQLKTLTGPYNSKLID